MAEDPYQVQKEPLEIGMIVFRNVVKLLKFYSKSKSIYGTNYCFFNGMTLQIMTLYVMEMLYEVPWDPSTGHFE